MSGFEAVGVILPLVLAALDHWESCTRPFARFKHFGREAKDFVDTIEIEKTIFRNECRYLLSTTVEQDIVSRMLESSTDLVWHDGNIDSQLSNHLGDSLQGCRSLMKSINDQLEDINDESRELKDILERAHQV